MCLENCFVCRLEFDEITPENICEKLLSENIQLNRELELLK